ncbi:MAG: type II CRISPR-associated endonuclease Cas1 [Bacteroidetes bacterium]|nr:type II CRISPR-associated endonuclease Cas1 [Bacteroidota bacterium]
MIKRTLYFGNPAYLKTQNEQLVVTIPDKNNNLPENTRSTTIPIEDIGVVILDNQQITISQALLAKLLENNAAIITCDNTHHPTGMMLNLNGNTLQAERFSSQINSSLPLKKQLWAQTVEQKIANQAAVLKKQGNGDHTVLLSFSKQIKSGDPDNFEGRAAAYYWQHLFGKNSGFLRHREGKYPNNLLNYGYAILRASVARALTGSGLLPSLGIHHRNKYNAYCLADDIMEPYRPYVDEMICKIAQNNYGEEISKEIKTQLLLIPVIDVEINGEKSPLSVALSRTSASLVKCYEGTLRKISYPVLI